MFGETSVVLVEYAIAGSEAPFNWDKDLPFSNGKHQTKFIAQTDDEITEKVADLYNEFREHSSIGSFTVIEVFREVGMDYKKFTDRIQTEAILRRCDK